MIFAWLCFVLAHGQASQAVCVLPAGRMAVLDVGAATPEQAQALKQHPALKQAFTVYVSRQAALKAGLAASGSPVAAIDQALANLQATQDAVTGDEGLVQVREGSWLCAVTSCCGAGGKWMGACLQGLMAMSVALTERGCG